MDYRALKDVIDAENDRIVDEAPDEVRRVVQFRIVDSGAGTGGNIMGTWFYALTDERYVVASLYQIILSANDPEFTLDQLKTMASVMLPKVTEFVGYCGFHKLWEFMEAMLKSMDQIDSREEFLDLLNSLFVYASHINAWIHHYFPWNIAYTFPVRTAAEVREMARLLDEA
jgi:hypothetical protein